MNIGLSFTLSMSCSVPAALGVIKYKRTTDNYKPFLLLMMIAVMSELIAGLPILVSHNPKPMYVAYPLYSLIEIFLWLLFFRLNNIFQSNKIIWAISLAGIITYLVSFILKQNILNSITDYCDTCFTVIIVILSVRMLSNEIFETGTRAYKNPKMIIALGCVFFYSYDLLESVFMRMDQPKGDTYLQIFTIHQVANLLSYLIFTWAIIWIPAKVKY